MILLLLACHGGVAVSGLTATPSTAMSTVFEVSWETDAPALTHLAYGVDGDLSLSTPTEHDPGTTHAATLWGVPFDATVEIQVVSDDPDLELTVDPLSVETGLLPQALAGIESTATGPGTFMALPVIGTATLATVMDPQGRYVWAHAEESGLDTYRVRLSRDGRHILYNAASVSGDPADDSSIVRVSLDGGTVEQLPVPLLAHDFVELPDGTIGSIAVEFREVDGEQIRGDKLVEIDPVSGDSEVVWSAWDCFDPAVDVGTDSEAGWTFANALDYDEEEDAWLLGIRNFSSIVQIDRASGACDWVFGDVAATFSPATGSASFLHQHQFERTPTGSLLVFDNDGAAGTVSRILEYDFDPTAGTATEIWSHTASPTIYGFVLGDVHRFDDGDTLVTWSVAGQVDRVSPDGTVTGSTSTGIGDAFGFNSILDSLYPAG